MKSSPSRLAGLAGATALAVTLVAASGSVQAGNGKAALAKLPQDTAMVFAMNVDRVKSSPLYQDVLKLVQMNQDVAKALAMLKAQTSFDINRDVQTVVVGVAADFDKTEKLVFLVEGKFKIAKFLEFAKKNANTVDAKTHRRVKYYTIDGDADVALLGKYLALSPKGHMKDVIDVHKGKRPSVKKNKQFVKLFDAADTSKDFWTVFVFPPDLRKQFKAQTGGYDLRGASAAVDIQKGLKTDVRLATTSLAAATALASLIKIGVQAAASDPQAQVFGLGGALSRIKVSQAKANVDIGFDLTPTELATITTMLKAFL